MILNKIIALISLTTLLYGCASPKANIPLVFGQSHTVGISIGGSAADQGVDFTLGYKDKDIAIVPVTIEQKDGGNTQIKAKAEVGHEDALSVFGQFELNSDTKQANVGLGKFFATGLAAKVLADGFKEKLAKEN